MKNTKTDGWKTEQLNKNVFRVSVPIECNRDWEQWVLLTSDRHWDNPHSDHKMQIKHLDQAKERNAPIVDAGDFLCLMQGKFDKRSSKSAIRPEHQVDNYLDAIINTAADFFAPYAKNFVTIATGNHEQSIADRYETNMIDRLCGVINDRTGSNVHNGGFSGWVVFSFSFRDKKSCCKTVLHYDHGYGGGGPVTADMIQHQRRAVYLPDADIVISGHTHDQWIRKFQRVRLDRSGSIRHDTQTHIKLPSYKDEYKKGFSGWHATKGMPPKPKGACWLRFYWEATTQRVEHEVIPV